MTPDYTQITFIVIPEYYQSQPQGTPKVTQGATWRTPKVPSKRPQTTFIYVPNVQPKWSQGTLKVTPKYPKMTHDYLQSDPRVPPSDSRLAPKKLDH